MTTRLFLYGVGIWIAGTVLLRAAGQYFIHPGSVRGTLILFAVSFPAMAWLVRRICSRFGLSRDEWVAGAAAIALPTLLLDPFSSAFFPVVFPNMAPDAAGVFGGWTLFCCAGALAGVMIGMPAKA